jgi:DNA polymerase III subunit delta'
MRISDVVGQDPAVTLLDRMLRSGKLPHALLFSGPAGVGKGTAARALAQALLCERGGCGECAACAKVAAEIHPDLLILRPGGAGEVIAIEAIRDVTARLAFAPHEAPARVVILEDADRLHLNAANAFLKTLEEPPPRSYFILLSAAEGRLLTTILSRCQRVRFAPLPLPMVAKLLEARGISPERARLCAALSGGSATRAVELATEEALEKRRARVRAILEASRKGMRAASVAASELAQTKDEVAPTLDLLGLWLRDVAAVSAGAPEALLAFGGDLDELRAEAARLSPGAAARRARAVLDAQTALLGYANAPLALEKMVLEIGAA